jgi:MFS family permease
VTGPDDRGRDVALWLAIAAMVAAGLCQGFIGPALDGFRVVLNGAAPAWMIPTLGAGSILAGVAIAPSIDRLTSRRTSLAISSVCAALGVGSMASARSAAVLLVGLVLFDLGFGIGASGWNAVLAEETHLGATRALGFGNAAFGVGIFGAPMTYAGLSKGDPLSFRPALVFGVTCFVLVAVATALSKDRLTKSLIATVTPLPARPAELTKLTERARWRTEPFLLIGLGLACSGVAESMYGTYFEDQLQVLGRVSTAPWKSGFWAMYAIGRFIVGIVGDRLPARTMLVTFLGSGLVASIIGVLTESPWALVATGLCVGAAFPMSMAIGNEAGGGPNERTALLTMGLLGGTIGPLLLGSLMERPGRSTLPIIGVGVYSLFLVVGLWARYRAGTPTQIQSRLQTMEA